MQGVIRFLQSDKKCVSAANVSTPLRRLVGQAGCSLAVFNKNHYSYSQIRERPAKIGHSLLFQKHRSCFDSVSSSSIGPGYLYVVLDLVYLGMLGLTFE